MFKIANKVSDTSPIGETKTTGGADVPTAASESPSKEEKLLPIMEGDEKASAVRDSRCASEDSGVQIPLSEYTEEHIQDLIDERNKLKKELQECRGVVLNLEAKAYMQEGVGKLRKGAIVRLEKMLETAHTKVNYLKEQNLMLNDCRKQQEDLNDFLDTYLSNDSPTATPADGSKPPVEQDQPQQQTSEETSEQAAMNLIPEPEKQNNGNEDEVKKEPDNNEDDDAYIEDPNVTLLLSQLSIKQREMITLQNMVESLKLEDDNIQMSISSFNEDQDLTDLKAYQEDLKKSKEMTHERMVQCGKDIAKKELMLSARGADIDSLERFVVTDGILLVKMKKLIELSAEEERKKIASDKQRFESRLKKAKSYSSLTIDALTTEIGNYICH